MKKALLALVMTAVVLMIAAWQSGMLSERVEVCEIDKETRERRCTVHGAAIGILIRVSAFLEHHGQAAIAACTIVLAISTILLWLATRRLQVSTAALREALRESGISQIAIAQQSADAAIRAAAAAEASVQAITETAQRQLRAYVSVQAILMELLESPRSPSRSDHDQEHRSNPGL